MFKIKYNFYERTEIAWTKKDINLHLEHTIVDKIRNLVYFKSEEEIVIDPFVFEDGEAMLQICF